MTKGEATVFLKLAIQKGDMLDFIVIEYDASPLYFESTYKIYNNLVEVGPEIACALHNNSSYIGDTPPSLVEREEKKIVSNLMPTTITLFLSEYLFLDRYQLFCHIEQ